MSISLSYALNSLVWSIVGFAAGLGAGRSWRSDVHRLAELAHKVTLGGVIIVLSLATVIFVFVRTQSLESKSRCQAQFNDNFGQVTRARAKYADDDRKSLNKLLKIVASTSATPKQNAAFNAAVQAYAVHPTPENLVEVFRILAEASKSAGGVKQSQALQAYLKETSEADQKRAAHPLPKLSEKCGS